MNTFRLDNHAHPISRVFKGNWQLAGGHGTTNELKAIEDLMKYTNHGVNTFDVGDIYTGVEEIVGKFLVRFRQERGEKEAEKLRVHTKFVPDLDALEDLTKEDVRFIIERSLERLNLKKLHLVQFHWWDYSRGDYIKAAKWLDELRQEGLIESIGLTNFDTYHTEKLIEAGIPIISNQVQFSLIDPRPLNGMIDLARKHDFKLFCYGVLAGGLLANARPGDEPTNRSHIKYKLIIDEVGEAYYREVLSLLNKFSKKYRTTPANIAAAYVLQTPGISSIILGPRNAKHLKELDKLGKLELSDEDYRILRDLESKISTNKSDVYSYERQLDGRHGQIMKYNLNDMHPKH